MTFRFGNWLKAMVRKPSRRERMHRRSRARTHLHLETLEDRTLLSAPVGTTGDLIAAINNANSSGGATTITLASGAFFDFTSANNFTNGANALPVITANITIVGNNDIVTRGVSSPFRLFDVASGGVLTLQNMSLESGLAQGSGASADGGAVYSSGALKLSGVTVQSNEAQGANGTAGAAGVSGGKGADAFGGGLYVAGGSVTLSNDTFFFNTAQGGNGGDGGHGGTGGDGGVGIGGGVYVVVGSVTLSNNAFNSNSAQGGNGGNAGSGTLASSGGSGGAGTSGGLEVAANVGTLTSSNDTFTSNRAVGGLGGNGSVGTLGGAGGNGGNGAGGGLDVAESSVTMSDDDLSDNYALGGNGGKSGDSSLVPGQGGAGGFGLGGGLDVTADTVNLYDDTVAGNIAQGGQGGQGGNATTTNGGKGGTGSAGTGGGLYVAASKTTLSGDQIRGNTAQGGNGGNGGNGGAVSHAGTGGDGGDGTGGGVYASPGSLTLGNVTFTFSNDTFNSNSAQGGKGGIGGIGALTGGTGGNGGGGSGGGLYVLANVVTLINDTVSGNQAQGGNGGNGGNGILGGNGGNGRSGTGGGLFLFSIDITLANTIIAEDTVTAGKGGSGGIGLFSGLRGPDGSVFAPDVDAMVGNSDHDLIGDPSGSFGFGKSGSGDLLNVDPKLDTLQNNGGPTQTMALLPDSPALDAGDNNAPGLPSTDQRGFARIAGAAVDIGAFESQSVISATNVTNVSATTANGTYGVGAAIDITVTFNNPVVVTGSPQLALNSGGIANYSSGSGTSTLTFVYIVAAGQNANPLDYTSSSALTSNGGALIDGAGKNANLTLPSPGAAGSLSANKDIIIDTTAPTIVAYYVLFGSQKYNLLGSSRFDLPWQITGIQVVFSKPIASGDISSLTGLTITGFSGLGTNTLTWTIAPVTIGKFASALRGSGADALKDAAGNALGGGDFAQNFNVLYGDFDDDGVVNSADMVSVNNLFRAHSYNPFADLNGDGIVDLNDVQIVRKQIGRHL